MTQFDADDRDPDDAGPGDKIDTVLDESYVDAVCTGERWERKHFERCDFSGADLRGLVTRRVTFDDCTFGKTDLGESRHSATAFRSCVFDRAVLAESVWEACSLLGSMFVDCRLRPWTVRDSDLTLTGLGGNSLRKMDLSGLRLREANLTDADLREVDLRQADLSGARLLGTRLDDADLRGATLDADGLVRAILTGARIDMDTAIAFAAAHGLRVG